MKMRVQAITREFDGFSLRARDDQRTLGGETGHRVVHLECGHEFVIPDDAPTPSFFDCRYCSRVQTIEEKERDDRRRHAAEGAWLANAGG